MLTFGTVLCCINGDGAQSLAYMLEGAESAVTLSISLAGSYILWMGIMNIAKRAGLIEGLARVAEKPLKLLMPGIGSAAAPVTLNLTANFFGLGNAATPFGLEAMRRLKQESKLDGIASNNMCMFLSLNASAIELLPTTVIAVRTACGSADAYSIVTPTLLSSIVAAIAAVTLCKLFECFGRGKINGFSSRSGSRGARAAQAVSRGKVGGK